MDLRGVLNQYHKAADEFARGDPERVKKIFSHQAPLANWVR